MKYACHHYSESAASFATPPDLLQESLGPFGPESVPEGVPESGGVGGSVRRGVPGTLWALGSGVSKKCPESVPGLFDTLGTLSGHFLATPDSDAHSDTLVFGDTLGDALGTLRGPKGPERLL